MYGELLADMEKNYVEEMLVYNKMYNYRHR